MCGVLVYKDVNDVAEYKWRQRFQREGRVGGLGIGFGEKRVSEGGLSVIDELNASVSDHLHLWSGYNATSPYFHMERSDQVPFSPPAGGKRVPVTC